jgi:D-sedoheptulose 7-phosphate isomerase
MNNPENIRSIIAASIAAKQLMADDTHLLQKISVTVDLLADTFTKGHRVYFCGNGGSAADAQHLAAEFTGRFYFDRPPLPAEALHTNTSYLTAVANDYSYDEVYVRLLRGIAGKGDVLMAFSTSGNSKNIIRALEEARIIGMKTVGFTGQGGGKMKDLCDILIDVPSNDTPRIQECHIMTGHIICQFVEQRLFGDYASS